MKRVFDVGGFDLWGGRGRREKLPISIFHLTQQTQQPHMHKHTNTKHDQPKIIMVQIYTN